VTHTAPLGVRAVDAELERALALLAKSRERPYYDEAADSRGRAEYWAGIEPSGDPAALYTRVHERLAGTHDPALRYLPARRLYPWVDLRPDGGLRSIYSGKDFDPEDVIRKDFAIRRTIEERVERLVRRGADESVRRAAMEAAEAVAPYNCEHVVPQSWFDHAEPMRGDLHHLFTCEWGCNSFRGNTPYFDFGHAEKVVRPDCGRLEEDKFEPSEGRGPVARATLYFLLRYPGEIAGVEEFPRARLDTLLAWHAIDPVDEYERHRNAAAAADQGNRNPLVDHPDWASEIDFGRGFARG
jgi:endonuclease G, mitochondrial